MSTRCARPHRTGPDPCIGGALDRVPDILPGRVAGSPTQKGETYPRSRPEAAPMMLIERNEMNTSSSGKVTALNAHLPEHLHLDPSPGLEAELDQAAAAGWTPDGLAAHIRSKAGPNAGPGLVVSIIRGASHRPQRPGTIPEQAGLITAAHPFTDHPDTMPGWCRCGLPRANRHHTPTH